MDRQDIDALLIGSLYGELTPADEARLTAHLESHPADRSALDGLEAARRAVRESRILDVQLEPPQAVSAMLLQEAHRRAPKRAPEEREGWFARLARSLLAHPAMAAATMLVLVLGVAGTVYISRGGDDFSATKTAERNATNDSTAKPADRPATEAAAAGSAAAPDGDTKGKDKDEFRVKLADENAPVQGQGKAAQQEKLEPTPPSVAVPHHTSAGAAPAGGRGGAPVAKKRDTYLEVQSAPPAPKELDERKLAKSDDAEVSAGGAAAPETTVASPGLAKGTLSGRAAGPAPASPPAPRAMTQPEPKMAAKPMRPEPAPTATAQSDVLAWASSQLDRAIQLAANNRCNDVVAVTNEIRNRANDFYNTNVATNRKLKGCKTYIDREAERELDRKAAERARKADEPAKAAPADATKK